jgi:hypothetical protein
LHPGGTKHALYYKSIIQAVIVIVKAKKVVSEYPGTNSCRTESNKSFNNEKRALNATSISYEEEK